MEVLFVCTGNASRSVMGEYLFRQFLARREARGIFCGSAGTEAVEDLEANADTVAVCREIGVDLTPHRRRLLTAELVAQADVLVVMEQAHADAALALGGDPSKLHWLSGGIDDPYGGPRAAFYQARDAVLAGLPALYDFVLRRRSAL